jgi:hypothetical protein
VLNICFFVYFLVLIGASHLRNIGWFIDQEAWKVFDLTTPGWRITNDAVQNKIAQVKNLASETELKDAVCILQLFDNSIYMVSGPLLVADKAGIKDLTNKLAPLLCELGGCKKLFLTPLALYWLSPCCDNEDHVSNYKEKNYLPKLNMAISGLRDYIRDALYIRRIANYRVLCLNKMIGLGPRLATITDCEAKEFVDLWGDNLVHPSLAAGPGE